MNSEVTYNDGLASITCPVCGAPAHGMLRRGELHVGCEGNCSASAIEAVMREHGVLDPIAEQLRHLTSGPERSPAPSWPAPMHHAAFDGLAGEIVREIEPHSEADPAALLVQFLVAVGNALGRGPGWQVEATRHYCNLFAAIVGDTASARKGTSWGQARRLVEIADSTWSDQIATGLSSGEGLIWLVRDPIETRRKAKKGEVSQADEHGFVSELADLGADDKRALVVESELASVLERMAREGNTLSAVLRQAWDGERLDTLVKSNQARATDAHVSVIGHITAEELRRKLTQTEMSNGFGNRFLWVCAKRSRVLPFGGDLDSIDWTPYIDRLTAAIRYGKPTAVLDLDADARRIWVEVYEYLTSGQPGMLGAITARAAAQVRPLAVIYSVLDPAPDRVPTVNADHLLAALAVWDYSERSASYLFGQATGDPIADKIIGELEGAGVDGLTRNELRDAFGRHRRADELDAALSALSAQGRVITTREETRGRPSTRYRMTSGKRRAEGLDLDALSAHTAATAQPTHASGATA